MRHIHKHGDVIWYYKVDKGVSINPEEICDVKYKKMPLVTVKDALEILGYSIKEIYGIDDADRKEFED